MYINLFVLSISTLTLLMNISLIAYTVKYRSYLVANERGMLATAIDVNRTRKVLDRYYTSLVGIVGSSSIIEYVITAGGNKYSLYLAMLMLACMVISFVIDSYLTSVQPMVDTTSRFTTIHTLMTNEQVVSLKRVSFQLLVSYYILGLLMIYEWYDAFTYIFF